MTVSATWVDPSAAGTLDLTTGSTVTETWTDGIVSDLLVLGGSTGTAGLFQVPTGVILPYAAASIPTGWLACDGSAVSRTTFSKLFGVISTTWGVGDGSTTFNVPDMRGKAAVGSGTGSGLTARTLAATGGEETHLLTTAETPAHTHTVNITDPTHTHTVTDPTHNHTQNSHNHTQDPHHHSYSDSTIGASGSAVFIFAGGTGINTSDTTATNQATTATNIAASTGITNVAASTGISATTSSIGSGSAHNNMQPFAVCTMMIKV